ncbi:MAG: D-2-hydroxyacid dehydrogenase [Fimbriimonadaceae bacterium]|nr:D-2-hydroxyacid dehydrogenase [Fimbriimonadaceae bacterium]
MNIVVLDGYTLNPGDLSWKGLSQLGSLTVHDRTPADAILERSLEADVLFTNKTPLTSETLALLPKLKYIGVLATGYNVVDVQAARARGIPVTNVPEYGTHAVAQATFALILELTNRVGYYSQTVRDGRWANSEDWCYYDGPILELSGLTLGVIGMGRIGSAVGRMGHAFGMTVTYSSRTVASGLDFPAEHVSFEKLLHESDVISLHCPLTESNKGMINVERIAFMKPSALLINTSRGPLIDQNDLASALNAGKIAGAALDVLSVEPPPADNPLLTAKNCIITPHIAWAARTARSRLLQTAVNNLQAFLDGSPVNVVK